MTTDQRPTGSIWNGSLRSAWHPRRASRTRAVWLSRAQKFSAPRWKPAMTPALHNDPLLLLLFILWIETFQRLI